jgi:hypothetical protein
MGAFHYFMFGVGGLAALSGLLILSLRIRTVLWGRVTQGVIVGERVETHRATTDRMRSVSYAEFEFEHEGQTYRNRSSFGAPRGLLPGAAVRVRYLPSDPKTSGELDTLMAMWFFPVAALAFGMLFIGLGIVLD